MYGIDPFAVSYPHARMEVLTYMLLNGQRSWLERDSHAGVIVTLLCTRFALAAAAMQCRRGVCDCMALLALCCSYIVYLLLSAAVSEEGEIASRGDLDQRTTWIIDRL